MIIRNSPEILFNLSLIEETIKKNKKNKNTKIIKENKTRKRKRKRS